VLDCELLKLARLVLIALFHFIFIQLFELLHIVHSYLEKRIVYCTLLILDLYFYAQTVRLIDYVAFIKLLSIISTILGLRKKSALGL